MSRTTSDRNHPASRGLRTCNLCYAAVFAPIAAAGPWIGAGDEMVVVAEKAKR